MILLLGYSRRNFATYQSFPGNPEKTVLRYLKNPHKFQISSKMLNNVTYWLIDRFKNIANTQSPTIS